MVLLLLLLQTLLLLVKSLNAPQSVESHYSTALLYFGLEAFPGVDSLGAPD